MKRITNYLIAMALMAFTFTSCEDVPSPFGQILPPGGGDEVETFTPEGSGTQADPLNVQGVLEYVTGLGADVQSDSAMMGIRLLVSVIPGVLYASCAIVMAFYNLDQKTMNQMKTELEERRNG